MRPFGALWRASDPAVSLVFLSGVTAVVLSARDLPWRGEWMWTLDWAAGSTVLSGPLTAGLAAYQSARWRSFTTHLALPTARRRMAATLVPGLAVLASSALVYVVGTLILCAITAAYHPTDRFLPVLCVAGFAKLSLCAAGGWLLGTRLPAYIAAAAAVAGAFAMTIAASAKTSLAFWLVGGSTGPSSGHVIDARYAGGALLMFMGLSSALASLSLIQQMPTRRLARPVAVASVAIVVLAVVLCSPAGATYTTTDPSPSWVCRGTPVSVCLLAGNTNELRAWSGLMNQAARQVLDAGSPVPARYEQPTADSHPRDTGVVFFDPGTINIRPPEHSYVAESLATPATCPEYADERPPIQGLNAREWLAQLILLRTWPADISHQNPKVATWVRVTPVDVQNRWLRATVAGLRACALSDVDIPVGQ